MKWTKQNKTKQAKSLSLLFDIEVVSGYFFFIYLFLYASKNFILAIG